MTTKIENLADLDEKKQFILNFNKFKTWLDRIELTIPELDLKDHEGDWEDVTRYLGQAEDLLARITTRLQTQAVRDDPTFMRRVIDWETSHLKNAPGSNSPAQEEVE